MYKFMRIQGREDSYATRYPKGIFSLCWNLIRDRAMTAEEEKLFISIDEWFKDHLPEPEPCKNHEQVITFFKCESTEPCPVLLVVFCVDRCAVCLIVDDEQWDVLNDRESVISLYTML